MPDRHLTVRDLISAADIPFERKRDLAKISSVSAAETIAICRRVRDDRSDIAGREQRRPRFFGARGVFCTERRFVTRSSAREDSNRLANTRANTAAGLSRQSESERRSRANWEDILFPSVIRLAIRFAYSQFAIARRTPGLKQMTVA